ncbi:Subtilisin-like protease SBT1.2 [Sesamum angolense]|uniref:Subtilisin-like protease SBT1.2 n=1 Tax=Sesamum angolense TaxID=2727404 RepID=A0AAE1W9Z0_9LAMI|nr:Subtilisin-like protease SBT1.2 [Sesamum angolense]
MAFISFAALICMLCIITPQLTFATDHTPEKSSLQTYIVHVEEPDGQRITKPEDLENWYRSFLPASTRSSDGGDERIVHSYRAVLKGFAARLSPDEVKDMEKKEGFIAARPEKTLSLHTTHTPSFLGLNQNAGFWNASNYGRGVIVGVLDTGIFPQHPSFSDDGMPRPPARWKGRCEFSNRTCNNKIIGARDFTTRSGSTNPHDDVGHGTHAAGIAAGNFVRGANVFGIANGTAVGIAPLAHLAIYKVCGQSCSESPILAGIDAAIEDGADVLSISIGGPYFNFFQDVIALGAFTAMQKGIFVSCSAGNFGALNPNARYCSGQSLSQIDVQGRIVLCEIDNSAEREMLVAKGQAVRNAGGAAMILVNNEQYANTTLADAHVLPTTHLSYADGLRIKAYINSTLRSMASILFQGTVFGDNRAPVVGAQSSRGPNVISPGILKPDILGPGINILAAWPTSVENNTNTASTFNVVSSTSMSCPHLSGVAALLKSAHPDWSPAAIKSAIMTTADVVNGAQRPIEDERFLPASIFATGAGHVNPSRANDPGLVYDIQPDDYIPYLCGLNYTQREIYFIVQRRVNCSAVTSIPEAQLNYPSFALTFTPRSTPQSYTRTVTNVGGRNTSYRVEIVPPPGINVVVAPTTLNFAQVNQKIEYRVTFSRLASAGTNTAVQGSLRWISSRHSVRSPIAVTLQ